MHEGACIAAKPFIAAHVVGELMKTGAHDDVARALPAAVRCRDLPEVAEFRHARDALPEANVLGEGEPVAIRLEIGRDLLVRGEARVVRGHRKVRHLREAS